jgi:prepilin-type N-terminal cleavage/methylation domain-containing protein
MDRMRIMKDRGITLIELIIVISIIGILLIALGFSFEGWMGSYRVESQTKEMYVDLMNARARAMQRNRVHFVRINNSTSYSIYEDDSDGTNKVPDGDGTLQTGTGNSADTQLPPFPKAVEYNQDWNNNSITAPINLTFNTKGIATTLGNISIFVDRDGDGKKDFEPDYDCIIIASTRINIGKLNDKGTTSRSDDKCEAK